MTTNTAITEKNLYEKGVLVALHIGGYAGRKKLSEEQLKGLPTEIVRGVHDLFDKEFREIVEKIWSHGNEVRGTVKAMTVQFPVDGVYFLKADRIEKVIDLIEEEKKKRAVLVAEAAEAYDEAVKRFAAKYPDFYKKAKDHYISREDFASRWYLEYQFLKIAPPDKDSLLSPELYKQEVAKFKSTIQVMKDEVVSTITTVLLEMTSRLKAQCTDGKPNQRTLNNLNKFLEQVDNVYSDFVDRKDLKAAIEKVRKAVLGVEADALRDSADFKKEFRKTIAEAADAVQALPDIPLKRAIEF